METLQSEVTNEQTEAKEKDSGVLRFVLDILETLVLSVILFIGINAVSARIRVDGSSMEPTLRSGEFVIVNKLAYKFGVPAQGDIVVFHFPRDPEQEYIKRVIGLPGDQVNISQGKVYVNDRLIDEPYIAAQPTYEGNWIVPEAHLFVLGDNRNNSSDSHNWGTVPQEYVVGKAVFIYWPPEQWGIIEHFSTASAAP